MQTPPIKIGFEYGFSSFYKLSLTYKVGVYGWEKWIQNLNQVLKEMEKWEFVFLKIEVLSFLTLNVASFECLSWLLGFA